MERYSIADVESLTGIKAHTLRKWEDRYKMLIPHRTGTNIRYYDDEQLRTLLNVATLLQNGYRISKVMAMESPVLNKTVAELMTNEEVSDHNIAYINALIKAMLAFDEPVMDKTLTTIFIRHGIFDAMTGIIYPFLRRTGMLWTTENASPSQEHFASMILRRKLLSITDGIPLSASSDKKFLLFLPPDEWHEMGLLLSDYVIRKAGNSTLYLGPNVPFNSIETALKLYKPTHLLTFFRTGSESAAYVASIKNMLKTHHNTIALICSDNIAENEKMPKNIRILTEPEALGKYL